MRGPAGAAALLFAVVLGGGSLWVGSRALGSTHSKPSSLSPTAAGLSASPTTVADVGLSYPPEAALGLAPHPSPRSGVPNPCDDRYRPRGQTDPAPGYPTSVGELGRRSAVVVVATASSQKSYWHKPAATEGTAPMMSWTDGLQPLTATNFRVERMVKGTSAAEVQVIEQGAPPGSLPCSGVAIEWADEHISVVGARYILFLVPSADVPSGYKLSFLTFSRFEVVDGTVHSAAEKGDIGFSVAPEPLDRFLARIT
jgi:hypothetical protein